MLFRSRLIGGTDKRDAVAPREPARDLDERRQHMDVLVAVEVRKRKAEVEGALDLGLPLALDRDKWQRPAQVQSQKRRQAIVEAAVCLGEPRKGCGIAERNPFTERQVNADAELWHSGCDHGCVIDGIAIHEQRSVREGSCTRRLLDGPSRSCTGNFFIDDELLASEGITNLDHYANVPGEPLFPDFFV